MSATFRFVYYSENPFVGARIPIGSIVREADGRLRVAKVDALPSVECLGSRSAAVGLRRLIDQLDGIHVFDALPPVFGPYTVLGEERAVPFGVEDAVSWVQRLLARPAPDPKQPKFVRGVQRASLGYRFFETWQVARHVHKTFNPRHDWPDRLASLKQIAGLPSITHWVGSSNRLLLMEPVIAERPQFDNDVKEIATRFLAYRYALGKMAETAEDTVGRLYAYLPAGGSPARRAEAKEVLADAAHEVFDTEIADERDGLLRKIRVVAKRATEQPPLFETRH